MSLELKHQCVIVANPKEIAALIRMSWRVMFGKGTAELLLSFLSDDCDK